LFKVSHGDQNIMDGREHTSAGLSPLQIYAWEMNARILYALRHSGSVSRCSVDKTGSLSTTPRMRLLSMSPCRFFAIVSHGV